MVSVEGDIAIIAEYYPVSKHNYPVYMGCVDCKDGCAPCYGYYYHRNPICYTCGHSEEQHRVVYGASGLRLVSKSTTGTYDKAYGLYWVTHKHSDFWSATSQPLFKALNKVKVDEKHIGTVNKT